MTAPTTYQQLVAPQSIKNIHDYLVLLPVLHIFYIVILPNFYIFSRPSLGKLVIKFLVYRQVLLPSKTKLKEEKNADKMDD